MLGHSVGQEMQTEAGIEAGLQVATSGLQKAAHGSDDIGGRLTHGLLFLSILLISFVVTSNLDCLYKRKQSLGDKSN